jgi:protein SCO1/2
VTGRRFAAAVAALLVLAGVLSGCTSDAGTKKGLDDNPRAGTYMGFALNPPQPRPNFTLTDTTGKPFSFAKATDGYPTFLYFGYTHCPDVCPTTMADIGFALQAVPADVRAKARVVFVTTDVAIDTGPVIADWLKAFKVDGAPDMIGLYGTQAQIDLAQAAANVFIASEGGKQHSAAVLLYGADNYARVTYRESDNESDAMAHDLPLVAGK